jgi:hypothetical protein
MIKVNRLTPWPCKQHNCFKPALYEFTDAEVEVKISDENGSSATSVETVIIGHACENHVEDVNKMLTKLHKR